MVRFILLRHGLTVSNKERRFAGQSDVPLDEIGVLQAKDAAKYILDNYRIDSIYSSDLQRAYNTAKPVADALGLEIHTDKALREVDVGSWQGHLVSEIREKYPEQFDSWANNAGLARCGDGESTKEVAVRALDAFCRIAAENEGKTVLVASHAHVIRTVLLRWQGVPFEEFRARTPVPNASVSEAFFDNGTKTAKVTVFGCNGYLSDKTAEIPVGKQ